MSYYMQRGDAIYVESGVITGRCGSLGCNQGN